MKVKDPKWHKRILIPIGLLIVVLFVPILITYVIIPLLPTAITFTLFYYLNWVFKIIDFNENPTIIPVIFLIIAMVIILGSIPFGVSLVFDPDVITHDYWKLIEEFFMGFYKLKLTIL